jgi:hypothetical protein
MFQSLGCQQIFWTVETYWSYWNMLKPPATSSHPVIFARRAIWAMAGSVAERRFEAVGMAIHGRPRCHRAGHLRLSLRGEWSEATSLSPTWNGPYDSVFLVAKLRSDSHFDLFRAFFLVSICSVLEHWSGNGQIAMHLRLICTKDSEPANDADGVEARWKG